MGLRLRDGIDASLVPEKYIPNINHLDGLGLISARDGRLRVTPDGMPLLDAVLQELMRAEPH
jgi:coproporphyrinogen III oxidase-like Fe-S oxidoreductase